MNDILEILKKNVFWIICGVVFLISVGLFISATLAASENQESFGKIKSEYDTAQRLKRQVVSNETIRRLGINSKNAQKDYNNAKTAALISSDRRFLSNKIFPFVSQEDSTYYYKEFAEDYCSSISSPEKGFIKSLNGGGCLSTSEVEQIRNDYAKNTTPATGGTRSGYGQRAITGGSGGNANDRSGIDNIIDEAQIERSTKIAIYINTDSFCCYDYWDGHAGVENDPTTLPINSWFSQVAYWVQEDVVASIGKVNNKDVSVQNNPIKRVLEISFSGTPLTSTGTKSGRTGTQGGSRRSTGRQTNVNTSAVTSLRPSSQSFLPAYLKKTEAPAGSQSTLEGNMSSPWTKRSSNELADVVHFHVGVIVSTSHINSLVNALQSTKVSPDGKKRNQISVLDISTAPLNIESEKQAGYYYGRASLSVLRINCEYAFFKFKDATQYAKKMPTAVKDLFSDKKPGSAQKSSPGRSPRGHGMMPGMPRMPGMPGRPPRN